MKSMITKIDELMNLLQIETIVIYVRFSAQRADLSRLGPTRSLKSKATKAATNVSLGLVM